MYVCMHADHGHTISKGSVVPATFEGNSKAVYFAISFEKWSSQKSPVMKTQNKSKVSTP